MGCLETVCVHVVRANASRATHTRSSEPTPSMDDARLATYLVGTLSTDGGLQEAVQQGTLCDRCSDRMKSER